MEFLHLKDQRGSGTEPLNVLSGYRWQDALGYYESTRDTASHFFIHYLPKGVCVFALLRPARTARVTESGAQRRPPSFATLPRLRGCARIWSALQS